jgi:hypothetical protein
VFVAGARHRPEGAGIRPAQVPLTSTPAVDVANPFRKRAPDDDAPPDVRVAERQPYPRRGLLLFLVFGVVAAVFGVTALLLMGQPTATTYIPPRASKQATKQATKPARWQTFTIPGTSSTVLVPGTPARPLVTKGASKHGDIREFEFSEESGTQRYKVATIRMPRIEVKPNELADWLFERIKDLLPANRRILDQKQLDELGGATGWEWTFGSVGEREANGVVRAYLSHDASGTTAYVFAVESGRWFLCEPHMGMFFDSIVIGEFIDPVEK